MSEVRVDGEQLIALTTQWTDRRGTAVDIVLRTELFQVTG